MTMIKAGEGMTLNTETNELFVKGRKKPFIVEPLTKSEQEGLDEWGQVYEKGKN